MPTRPFRESGVRGAKLAPPRPPVAAVPREALLSRVERAQAAVITVCAPAGFGKTTVLEQISQAFTRRELPVAWVNLDPADNELTRFAHALRAGLARALPGELELRPQPLTGPGTGVTEAKALLGDLPFIDVPFALFLDDFEQLRETAVLDVVNQLIAGLEEGQHLVLASRSQPPLALGRLRARGRLLEIDTEALRFSAEETARYLSMLTRPGLSPDTVLALQKRTEGWPAALQLAAISLAGAPPTERWVDRLSGSQGALAEYLAQDVLSRLPEEERDFLLRTSALPEFCAELCDFVLQIDYGNRLIEQIRQDNLFLIAHDADRGWYRYHPLFAEFLRGQLMQEDPFAAPELRRRAAWWYAEHNLFDEAVDHAFAIPDTILAASLLDRCAMDFVKAGRITALVRWLDALPTDRITAHPELLRAAAYAFTFAHRYDAASVLLQQLETVQTRAAGAEDRQDDTLAMRLMLFGWTDRLERFAETVDRAVRAPRTSDAFTAGLTLNAVAFIDMTLGRHAEAQAALAQCRTLCEPIHALYVLSYATCFQAAVELVCGNVVESRELLSRAMARVVDARQRYSSAGAVVATYLAEVLYEQNELEASQALLVDYLPVIADTGMPDHVIIAHRTSARIHFKCGEREAAFERLAVLDELGVTRGITRLRATASLERGHLFLLAGDTENAGRVIQAGLGDPAWAALSRFELHAHDIEPPELARIRLLLACGQSSSAQRAIQDALDKARAGRRIRRSLRLRFLQGVATDAQGRRPQADELLFAVLREARARRLIRVIADEPSGDDALWDRLIRTAPQTERSWIRELGMARAQREPRSLGESLPSQAGSPLSSRETQILRLVAAGQSNKQLARSLFVTENTVESHLRRINAKLGTRTRTQALAKAREIGTI